MVKSFSKVNQPWHKNPYTWMVTAAASVIALLIGWYIPRPATPPKPLRLTGYKFIDPLLVCNGNNSKVFPEDISLGGDIESLVRSEVKTGNISKASTYFLDLTNGKWSTTFADKNYYPSSLGKIPIMMAYYQMAEIDPAILQKKINYAGGEDLNTSQDIQPARTIVPGKTYSVEQLIEYMIQDSDNNATQLLFNSVDKNALNNIYSDLGIPTISNATESNLDLVKPVQIGYLFRVLYNGTYISREYSEKALSLMSQSSFRQGIVAGVPSSTIVSNKMGLVGFQASGVSTEHELHDCGIIYGKHPYILCAMTRGSSDLQTMEGILAKISATAYKHMRDGSD